jgi:hypothetical protein
MDRENPDDLEITSQAETPPVTPRRPAEHLEAEPEEAASSVENKQTAETDRAEVVHEGVIAGDFIETDIEVWPSTLKAEALRDRIRVTKVARLIAKGRFALSRGKEANLEAGRTYEELRPYFTYGTWLPFLKSEATIFGISYRSDGRPSAATAGRADHAA